MAQQAHHHRSAIGAGLLAADLRALLEPVCAPSPADVTVTAAAPAGGSSKGPSSCCCHRALLWARVPQLRAQLQHCDGCVALELPPAVGLESFEHLALPFLYTGELPSDRLPLADDEMRALLALSEAWQLPGLRRYAIPGKAGGRLQIGGLLGVVRPQVEALRAQLSAAYDEAALDRAGSPFFDVSFSCWEPSPAGCSEAVDATDTTPTPAPAPAGATMVGGNRAILCSRSGFFRAMLGESACPIIFILDTPPCEVHICHGMYI
jgi:hypothetical protein